MVSTDNSFADVIDLFKDRLEADVASITLDDSSVTAVQDYFYTFPEKKFYSKSDFPIVVVDAEDSSDTEYTYGKDEVGVVIIIETHTTKTEERTKLMGAIYNSIKNYEATFRENGVTNLNLDDKDIDSDKLGSLNIREGLIKFSCTFRRPR